MTLYSDADRGALCPVECFSAMPTISGRFRQTNCDYILLLIIYKDPVHYWE